MQNPLQGRMPFRALTLFAFLLPLCKSASLNLNEALNDELTVDSIPCEEGWMLFGQYCYLAKTEYANWDTASCKCANLGGHLASIHSQEEQDFLTVYSVVQERKPFWIGLNDKVEEGNYVWEDGSDVDYTYWNPGEPKKHTTLREDCIEMYTRDIYKGITGGWNDRQCSVELPYVCKKEKNETLISENPLKCSSARGGGQKFRGSCYTVLSESKTWEDAERYCQDHFAGHLVTISDFQDDWFLNYTLWNFTVPFWTGIKLRGQRYQKWASGRQLTYNLLAGGTFSQNREGFCVVRFRPKLWVETSCHHDYAFICESPKDDTSTLKSSWKGWKCPESPYDWRDLDGEFCYYLSLSNSVTWYEAHEECLRRGGLLASILSGEESDLLQPFLEEKQGTLFIGLNSLLSNGNRFLWSDGTPLNYTQWFPEYTKKRDKTCVYVFSSSMMWHDSPCDSKRSFICSVRKVFADETTNETQCNIPASFNENIPAKQIGSQDAPSNKNFSGGILLVIAILLVLLTAVLFYHFRPWLQKKRKHISYAVFKSSIPEAKRQNIWSAEAIIKEEEDNENIK